jgi:peptidoglycan hydrolase CwlO-like protein
MTNEEFKEYTEGINKYHKEMEELNNKMKKLQDIFK